MKVYRSGKIIISPKKDVKGENVERWRLSGSLDGGMVDVVPGGGRAIEGDAYVIEGWTVEWWKRPVRPKNPVKVIVITSPAGRSKTL